MNKFTIAILFGSRSMEHDISCISVVNVISNIDTNNYNILIIGITKDGRWLLVDNIKDIVSGDWINNTTTAIISPDTSHKGLLIINNNKVNFQNIDIVFPVLHGLNGEDGTIQGLLELAHIPYVGSGVTASCVSMDKLFSKIIAGTLGIRCADYILVSKSELSDIELLISKVEASLNYPVFIKPANSGSSKGVSKASNRLQLLDGIYDAAKYDNKIIIEATIIGRELECAILGSKSPIASGVGEIITKADFYDYEAKYINSKSTIDISPVLPNGIEKKIRDNSLKIFSAIGGSGLARIDYFLEKDTNDIIFNELNTMPGFTSISMYPKLWEVKGISKSQLLEKLIQSGLHRYE